jgi:hypothetical protein
MVEWYHKATVTNNGEKRMAKIKATLTVYCASIYDEEAGFTVDELIEETNNEGDDVEVSPVLPLNEDDEHSDREFTVIGEVEVVRKWIGHFYSLNDEGVQDLLNDGTWYYEEV